MYHTAERKIVYFLTLFPIQKTLRGMIDHPPEGAPWGRGYAFTSPDGRASRLAFFSFVRSSS